MAEDEMYSAGFRTNQVAPSADGLNTERTLIGTLDFMLKVIHGQTTRLNED
jgi:hypothetical protein